MISVSQKSKIYSLLNEYLKSEEDSKALMKRLEGIFDEKSNTERDISIDPKYSKSLVTGFSRKTDKIIQIIMLVVSIIILIVAFA